ncbi:MAG: hypothetical protein ABJC74_04660 [Gemmatimonadota bacterium]
MRWSSLVVLGGTLALTQACNTYDGGNGPTGELPAPSDLTYQVEPVSPATDAPTGVLLSWQSSSDPALAVWHVYSRGSSGGAFSLRASTTSPSFHDAGVPDLDYYVTAEDVDGGESAPSAVVTIDERLALVKPTALTSTSLNGAAMLSWTDNAYTSNPTRFSNYRIYSSSYDLDLNVCGTSWSLEGTTVAPEFLVGALTNGVPRCFGVTAVSVEGYESLWSPLRNDTPRPDSHNIVVYARQAQDAGSGFRFWRDTNHNGQVDAGELGQVGSGTLADNDLTVERDGTGKLFLAPLRAGTGIQIWGNAPAGDLTDVDYAPADGYTTDQIEAVPGWAYVLEMSGGDSFARYGALRVTHVGTDYLILDWAFQTDPGDPELIVKQH